MVSTVGIGCNAFGRRVDARRRPRHRRRRPGRRRRPSSTPPMSTAIGRSEELLGVALQGRRDELRRRDQVRHRHAGHQRRPTGGRAARAATYAARSRPRCDGSAPTASTCTSSTSPTRSRRSRRPSRSSPTWSARARSATSASPTSPAGRSPTADWTARSRGLRAASSPSRTATPCSTARSRPRSCRPRSASGSALLPYYPLEYGLLTGKYRRGQEAPAGSARRSGPSPWLENARLGPDRGPREVRRGARRLDARRRDRRARRPAGCRAA